MRGGCGLVEEALLGAVQRAGALDVQAQQPRERQVDLLDLGEVELVAEAADPLDLLGGQRLLGGRPERGPGARGRARRTARCRGRPGRAVGSAVLRGADAMRDIRHRLAGHVRNRGVRRARSRPSTSWSRGCAGWSTAATTRPASPSSHERRASSATSGPASWPTSTRRSPRRRCPAATTGIGHTRWATHGAPNDANAHPHRGRTRPGRASCTTGSSRTSRSCARELEAQGHECCPRPTPRWPRTCSSARCVGGADLTAAMQAVCRRLEGAFTLVAVDAEDPTAWWPRAATRRSSSGSARARTSSASDVAAFIEHTREALELGQDQVVTITRDGVDGHRLRRQRRRGPAVPRRLGPLGRREGRLRLVHAQGDLRAAAGRAPTRCWAGTTTDGQLQLDEMRLSEDELRDVDKIIIIACGTAFYAGLVAKYAIEHWTRIPCEVELATEFRYRDPILDPSHPGGRDQPVRRDRRHAAWRSGTRASSARRCSRSATPTARRSRASPTRSSTPTPAPRSASRRPRAS